MSALKQYLIVGGLFLLLCGVSFLTVKCYRDRAIDFEKKYKAEKQVSESYKADFNRQQATLKRIEEENKRYLNALRKIQQNPDNNSSGLLNDIFRELHERNN